MKILNFNFRSKYYVKQLLKTKSLSRPGIQPIFHIRMLNFGKFLELKSFGKFWQKRPFVFSMVFFYQSTVFLSIDV